MPGATAARRPLLGAAPAVYNARQGAAAVVRAGSDGAKAMTTSTGDDDKAVVIERPQPHVAVVRIDRPAARKDGEDTAHRSIFPRPSPQAAS